MQNDLISIILPVYNSEKYLEKSLNSILNQTYKNIEIIIINDGSTDRSLLICEKYSQKDSRIKLFQQENKGVSATRNLGIDNAFGEYIIFIDSDDYIEYDMIEKLHFECTNRKCDIAICNYVYVVNEKKVNNIVEFKNEIEIFDSNAFRVGIFENKYSGFLWNKLIRKSCIKNVKFNEEIHIMEDLIFLCSISHNIGKVCFLPNEFLYNYVKRNNSALNSINEKYISILDAYKILKKYIEEIKDENLKNKYYFDYVFAAMNIYYYLYCQKRLFNKNKKELLRIRNKYIRRALDNTYYNFNKKIKIFLCSFLPVIYGRLKGVINK